MEEEILRPGEIIKPTVSVEDVERLVFQLYGFRCESIKELNGYDDKNYRVTVSECSDNMHIEDVNKDGYVLKIINSLDSKNSGLFEAQTKLLLHLGTQDICCPQPVKNLDGKYFSLEKLSSGSHIVRLLKFIKGRILHEVSTSNGLCYECGQYIAKLDKALANFNHPAYENHKTLWMLDSVPELEKFLYVIKESDKQKCIQDVIKSFQERVLRISHTFEKGMIHGDFNEQNILVEKQNNGEMHIKGVLDFGDSHVACYLYELAITMTYLLLHFTDLDVGGYILAGYRKIRQLPSAEFKLLRVCIAARLSQSLVLGAYSYLQDPTNTYVLTTAKKGWSLLDELWTKSDEDLLNKWNEIAENYNNDKNS